MSRTSTKSAKGDRDERRGQRRLREQPHRFVGLFLAPFAGLITAWLIHYWTQGVRLDKGPLHWHVNASGAAPTIANTLIILATVGLAYLSWQFADHRKTPLRASLTGSVGSLGILFAINVGTGPHYWWSGIFILTGWFVAITWSIVRLDVTRADPREEGEHEDTLLDKLGLGRWGFKVKHVETDRDGEPIRVEVDATHGPGDVINTLQSAVPAFESATGAPAGMSRATPTDAANRSNMTLILKDPLKGRIPYGPLSHPRGSIGDPITFAIYDDGKPVWVWLANGGRIGSPTGYGFMGMTRTGKTVGENELLTETESRCDVVICYVNKAKGMQDIRPVIPGIEVAVIAEGGADDGVAEYRAALEMVKSIMTYRQAQLALFGISAWSPRCFSNPPTRRLPDGRTVTMEPMPYLLVHVGEADAILEKSGEQGVYVSSKGLSVGVGAGWSLQRASAESMPTGLRFNVGLWWCFGTGDEYSAGFALTDDVIRAGAHPENWGQRKPGNHFVVGPGIEEENFAKRAKTMSLVGDDDDLPTDVLDTMLQDEMLRRNIESAPFMAKLDRGSAEATGAPGEPANRWDLLAKQTDRIRRNLLGGTANMTAADRNPPAPQPYAAPQTAPQTATATFTPTEPAATEDLDDMDEIDREIAETTEVGGIPLYDDDEVRSANLSDPLPLPPADDDTTFEDPKPAPLDRGSAVRALHEALRLLIEDPTLRDPADPTGNTVIIQTKDIVSRYPYRSRPWFAGELAALARGQRTPPPCLALELVDDTDGRSGKYRLKRVPDDDTE